MSKIKTADGHEIEPNMTLWTVRTPDRGIIELIQSNIAIISIDAKYIDLRKIENNWCLTNMNTGAKFPVDQLYKSTKGATDAMRYIIDDIIGDLIEYRDSL